MELREKKHKEIDKQEHGVHRTIFFFPMASLLGKTGSLTGSSSSPIKVSFHLPITDLELVKVA